MGFRSKATVTKSRSIARVVAPPAPIIVSPTGASLVTEGGQVVAGGAVVNPTGAQLVTQGGTPVYGGINARPTGAQLVYQGGTPGLSPNLIGNLVAWWDASQILGLTDGNPVSSWSDLSGSGYTMTAADPRRPLYKTAIQNGLPVVRFDGIDDALGATIGSLSQPFTIWLIVKHGSTPSSNEFLACSDAFIGIYKNTTPKYVLLGGTNLVGSTGTSVFHLILGVFNGTSSIIAIDGTETTGNGGTTGLGTTFHFGSDQGSGENSDMDLCEAGVASVGWDAGQRAAILAYARAKWATP